MTSQTIVILEVLTHSANKAMADNARHILKGTSSFVPYKDMAVLAATGILGGFLQAVMAGNLTEIWRRADELNQAALAAVIPVAYR